MKSQVGRTLLPYDTILSASMGDVEAITLVMDYYESYISALSTRTLYDENKIQHLCVDYEMRRRLETKLITRITSFDASSII